MNPGTAQRDIEWNKSHEASRGHRHARLRLRREAFHRAVDQGIDLIGCDGGSMDLGAGVPSVSRRAYKRDLTLMLEADVKHGVPVVIGSASGGGGAPHVAWTRALIEEIATEQKLQAGHDQSSGTLPNDCQITASFESEGPWTHWRAS